MNYWILQHNPAILPISNNYPSQIPHNLDYWRIRWYVDQVCVEDQAFLWYSNANRSKRGIYNIAKIVSIEPHNTDFERYFTLMWENDRPRYNPDALARLQQYSSIIIKRQYSDDFNPPCNVDELFSAGFHNLSALKKPYQWGIRRLNQTEGKQLLQYIQTTRP